MRTSLKVKSPYNNSIWLIFQNRYHVNINIIVDLYYAPVHSLLFFSLISWGNSYEFNLHPVFLLQKRVIRIITFSSFFKHTSPFFKSLVIMKFFDHVQFILSDSMYKFHKHFLTSVFSRFLTPVKSIFTYITRLASQLLLLFQSLALLMNILSSEAYLFKKKLENFYFDIYPVSSAAPVDNMKRILCSDWLAERARWTHLARWGLAALIARKKKVVWSKLTKFVILGQCRP